MKTKKTVWQKPILMVVTVALTLLFLWTVRNSLLKLQEGKITVTSGSLHETALWPSVTTCNKVVVPAENYTVEDVVSHLPGRDDLIHSIIFTSDTFSKEESTFPERSWQKHVRISYALGNESAYEVSTCFTLKIGQVATHLDQLIVYPSTNSTSKLNSSVWLDPTAFSVTIHQDDQFVFSVLDMGGMSTIGTDDLKSMNAATAFQFQMEVANRLNTETSPCDVANGQSLSNCMDEYMCRRIGCCMPWVNQNACKYTTEVCTSTESIADYAVSMTRLQILSMEQLVNLTGCTRNCLQYSYSSSYATEYGSDFAIALTTTQDAVPVSNEVYLYSVEDLMADVGGYLGLLIGASVLTLFEYLVKAVDVLVKMLHRRNSEGSRRV